jgi:glyoxylase-like metal-dependent hydrolase (beta-lactamase superfamily II)
LNRSTEAEAAPGEPKLLRLRAPNPGPMTLTGTNTYVIATEPAWVVDPGPDNAAHIEAIRETCEPLGGIEGVVLTHSHSDHAAAVAELGAPLEFGQVGDAAEFGSFEIPPVPELPADGRVGPLGVLATPGHAADHVAYTLGDVCICGDLILGEGSTIVPPTAFGGSLADYMRSLDVVEALAARLMAPGHGPWIEDPQTKVAEYREHRLERERRLLAALDSGERSRNALLDSVWDDVPSELRLAAAAAMQAHLEKLEVDGRFTETLGE